MERWQRILQEQLLHMPIKDTDKEGIMKFERLILHNFMRYKGRNELEFSCDEQKNVTVVLGDNTVGKTTIAQAFRFGLYGEIQIENGKIKEDYQLLNSDVVSSMDSNARESVFVEITLSNDEKRYEIHREIAYIRKYPSNVLTESYRKKSLSFSENYGGLKEIPEEEMESVIQEMFPRDLAGYFLFDGEKWNTGNLGGIKENIKESVHKLTGLSSAEKAMFHIADMGKKAMEEQKQRIIQDSVNRTNLIAAARKGDEDAIEMLTMEDMDMYSTISRKIQKEDVFSIVDTYFMPYGVECDHYSVLGEIMECTRVRNRFTGEEIFLLKICCNELTFDVAINIIDMLGEPKVGRRFKGTIWLQGFINFPDSV